MAPGKPQVIVQKQRDEKSRLDVSVFLRMSLYRGSFFN